jgi:hypothetical protein
MLFRVSALLSLASLALAAEPKFLRTKDLMYEQAPAEIVYYEEDKDDCDVDCDKKGSFTVEKGGKCTGGFDKKKGGMTKHCEGGMKKEFSMKTSDQEMNEDLASELMDQFQGFMPESNQLVLSDEDVEALLMNEDGEVDISKSVEFGGSMKIEWGCKMSFEKTDKGLGKKVECGAKADSVVGKKDGEVSVLEYYNKDGK